MELFLLKECKVLKQELTLKKIRKDKICEFFIEQCWYKHKISNRKSSGNNFFAISCWEVFVTPLCPFNNSMETKSLEYSGHSRRTDIPQVLTDVFSLHPKCHVFAPADYFQYLQVAFCQEI